MGQIYKVIMTDAIVPFRQRAGHLPRPFVELVDRMLSRDRSRRPADMSAVLTVLADYTDETFALVTGPPVTPSVAYSGLQPAVDPDTAHAAISDDSAQPNRSGIEVPSRSSSPPRRRAPLWAIVAALAATAVGAAGIASWRTRAPQVPQASAVNAPAGLASNPSLVELSPPTTPPETASLPSAVPSSGPGEAAAPAVASPVRGAGKHPRPAASIAKVPVSPSTPPSGASPVVPARSAPSAAPVDPGSYQ